MLEAVGIEIAGVERGVRLDVIVELDDFHLQPSRAATFVTSVQICASGPLMVPTRTGASSAWAVPKAAPNAATVETGDDGSTKHV